MGTEAPAQTSIDRSAEGKAKLKAETIKLAAETESLLLGNTKTTAEIKKLSIERDLASKMFNIEIATAEANLAKELSIADAQMYNAQVTEIFRNREKRAEAVELARDNYHHTYSFNQSVSAGSVRECIDTLNRWMRNEPGCPITVIFDSPGGSVIDGMHLWDFLSLVKTQGHNVTTIALGMAACVEPQTKVLTADLRWTAAGDLNADDFVLAFDDQAPQDGTKRKWQIASVTECGRAFLPSYRLTFDDGTVVVASSEHKWLTGRSGGHAHRWLTTEALAVGERGSQVIKPVDVIEPDRSYETGWVSGFYDGEGCITMAPTERVMLAQNPGFEMETLKSWLNERQFNFHSWMRPLQEKRKPSENITIRGGMAETMRFLQITRPTRLLTNFAKLVPRASLRGRRRTVRLVNKEFLGSEEMVTLSTSSGTFIAEGLATHNSMAGILLQAGNVRVLGKESYLLIHEVSFGAGGKLGEVEDEVKFVKKIQKRVLDIFANRMALARIETGEFKNYDSAFKSCRSWVDRNWQRKDLWLDSDECLRLGLVDETR